MTQNNNVKIIGITGGSGCGKTTVSNILKNLGAFIIDADFIAHNVIKNGEPAYDEIINCFGNNILLENKEIDRKKLAQKVFSDSESLQKLNDITHKYILQEIYTRIEYAKSLDNTNIIVIDAPLLIETNLHKIVHQVWIVFASKDTQIKRLMQRDLISKQEVENRLAKQTPFEKNKVYADFIIYNEENTNLQQIILNKLEG